MSPPKAVAKDDSQKVGEGDQGPAVISEEDLHVLGQVDLTDVEKMKKKLAMFKYR